MRKRLRRKLSEATKYKMHISKLGTKNPMKGKHHSEDSKRKISSALKKYWQTIPME